MSIELNTKSMRLEFDEETGAVYRITALKTGWDIMNSRESGLSWRIMIPLSEELRNNNALGEKQRLSSYQADEDRIVFRWDRIHSERGGEHEISVVLTIRSEGRQAVYEMEIDNRSALYGGKCILPVSWRADPAGGGAVAEAFRAQVRDGRGKNGLAPVHQYVPLLRSGLPGDDYRRRWFSRGALYSAADA